MVNDIIYLTVHIIADSFTDVYSGLIIRYGYSSKFYGLQKVWKISSSIGVQPFLVYKFNIKNVNIINEGKQISMHFITYKLEARILNASLLQSIYSTVIHGLSRPHLDVGLIPLPGAI